MHLELAAFAERAFACAMYFAKNVTSFFDINAISPETSHCTYYRRAQSDLTFGIARNFAVSQILADDISHRR